MTTAWIDFIIAVICVIIFFISIQTFEYWKDTKIGDAIFFSFAVLSVVGFINVSTALIHWIIK